MTKPKVLDTKIIKQYLEDGISRQCAPSMCVGIFLKDGTHYEIAAGHHTYNPQSKETEITDIYDLASLTKVVATTLIIMKLYEEKILLLDEPLIHFMPEILNIQTPNRDWRLKITPRYLLAHCAGFNSSVPKSDFPPNSTHEYRKRIVMNSVLAYEPGTKTIWSDVGFMLLYIVAEELLKSRRVHKSEDKNLTPEQYLKKYFVDPLEMVDTCYNPLEQNKDKNRIVPTEKSIDAKPGETYLWGVVHDQKARHVGGVDGHAGLFSTVPDLLHYIELFLNKGTYRGKQILKPKTIELFMKKADIAPESSRCLGLDTNYVSAGIYTSLYSVGHTGFTGTFINFDPIYGVGYVLLANAVHPDRSSKQEHQFFPFRNQLGSLIYEQLGFTDHPHPTNVVSTK